MRGETYFASFLIGSILVSLIFQLILVVGNVRKRGAKRIIIESIYTIARIKNAVNAYRLSKGQVEAHEKDEIDPQSELACLKLIKIVSMSIPSLTLQLYAVFASLDKVDSSFPL